MHAEEPLVPSNRPSGRACDAQSAPGSQLTPWNGRAILHVDLDAFFAAVEQLDHPEWRGRPVIVGGSPEGRGVVSTASYEARKFGIRSAMPAARAVRLAPPDAVWARPRFERYKEISDAVFAIFAQTTHLVQPLSIDEAFLDVTSAEYGSTHPVTVAEEIALKVAELGVTCSVGVATSKTVAKIASDFDKPCGITVVPPGTEAAFLAPLPVEAMSGIGPKTAGALRSVGITTLGELAGLDERTATSLLGSAAAMFVDRARGVDPRPVHTRDPVKSVSNERTFADDLRRADEIREAVRELSAKVARRLRKKGLSGRTITVKVRFTDFTTRSAQRSLDAATDTEGLIAHTAHDLVEKLWTPGVGVRLLGVGVTGLQEMARQLDLLEETLGDESASAKRRDRLTKGIDAVHERFGEAALQRGMRDVSRKAPDAGEDSGGNRP